MLSLNNPLVPLRAQFRVDIKLKATTPAAISVSTGIILQIQFMNVTLSLKCDFCHYWMSAPHPASKISR